MAGYGYYKGEQVAVYDIETGLYYQSISVKVETKSFLSSGESDKVVNIAIYNPKTEQHHLLFEKNLSNKISLFLFEQKIVENQIKFHGDNYQIKNNRVETQRPIKNKLLIGVYNPETKITTLWTATKNGEQLKKLTNIPSKVSWHIDVKNNQLNLIDSHHGKFKINHYDW